MEDEDFLAAVEADNVNAPVEEANEPEKAPEPEQEAPKEPEAEPEAPKLSEPATPIEPPVPTEVTPAPKEPPHVPLAAHLDERERRQKAEAELAQFRARQAQAQQQVQIPDRYEDPEGYEAYQESRIQIALQNQTLNTSERFARKEYGAETVEAAKVWAKERFASDPLYQQQILRDADPYEKVVADYRKEQLFSKVTDPSEFDAFLAWKAAQSTLEQQGGQPPPPNQTSPIPPRSLASAPSAGGISSQVEQSDAEMFDEVIPKG